MNKRLYLSIAVVLSITNGVQAQEPDYIEIRIANSLLAVTWDANTPLNNKFISKSSLDGFRFEYRKLIKQKLSVGMEASWNSYYQHAPIATHPVKNGAVTTDAYKYMYTLPLALNAHYYLYQSRLVLGYAGLALGATYSEQREYYSTFASTNYNWGALVKPEAGVIIRPSEVTCFGFLLAAQYSYSSNKQSSIALNGIQSLGVQVGIVSFY